MITNNSLCDTTSNTFLPVPEFFYDSEGFAYWCNFSYFCTYKHTVLKSGGTYYGMTHDKLFKFTKSRLNYIRWYNGSNYENQVFGRAIAKYGWDNIKHEVCQTFLGCWEVTFIECCGVLNCMRGKCYNVEIPKIGSAVYLHRLANLIKCSRNGKGGFALMWQNISEEEKINLIKKRTEAAAIALRNIAARKRKLQEMQYKFDNIRFIKIRIKHRRHRYVTKRIYRPECSKLGISPFDVFPEKNLSKISIIFVRFNVNSCYSNFTFKNIGTKLICGDVAKFVNDSHIIYRYKV